MVQHVVWNGVETSRRCTQRKDDDVIVRLSADSRTRVVALSLWLSGWAESVGSLTLSSDGSRLRTGTPSHGGLLLVARRSFTRGRLADASRHSRRSDDALSLSGLDDGWLLLLCRQGSMGGLAGWCDAPRRDATAEVVVCISSSFSPLAGLNILPPGMVFTATFGSMGVRLPSIGMCANFCIELLWVPDTIFTSTPGYTVATRPSLQF